MCSGRFQKGTFWSVAAFFSVARKWRAARAVPMASGMAKAQADTPKVAGRVVRLVSQDFSPVLSQVSAPVFMAAADSA